MPRELEDGEVSESRTQSVGANERPRGRKSARRNRGGPRDIPDFFPAGSSSSQVAPLTQQSSSISADRNNSSVPQLDGSADNQDRMVQSNRRSFGQNRLATGFIASNTASAERSLSTSQSQDSIASSGGRLHDEPIEISDDDDEQTETSEGGMVINIEGRDGQSATTGHIVISDEDDEMSDSSVEHRANVGARHQPQEDLAHSTNGEGTTIKPYIPETRLRLIDLNPEELEKQIKYGLWHLDRHRIDLNRPVLCLGCLEEGHLAQNCAEKNCIHCGEKNAHSSRSCPLNRRCGRCRKRGHLTAECNSELRVTTVPCDLCNSTGHTEDRCPQQFFPPRQAKAHELIELWLSCCVCASKDHLVGDCPVGFNSRAAAWSVKTLEPDHIVNLSLQSGMQKMEKEAANRNMRPQGLQIKGRAGLHQTGVRQSRQDAEEDDEPFLRAPIGRKAGPPRSDFRFNGPEERYDRFEAPTDDRRQDRGRNHWYGTDSFGRRRSRSPNDGYHTTGPNRFDDDRGRPDRRSQTPPNIDRYRPGVLRRSSPAPPVGRQPPPTYEPQPWAAVNRDHGSRAQANIPQRDMVIQLPTRKGSNTWINSANNQQQPPASSAGTSGSKNSNKKQKQNSSRGKNKRK